MGIGVCSFGFAVMVALTLQKCFSMSCVRVEVG